MKGSRVETIEDARKEYKQLLEEGFIPYNFRSTVNYVFNLMS